MSKLAIGLALGALGLGAFVAHEGCGREQRLAGLEGGLQHVQGSVDDLDAKLDRVLAALGREAPALLAAQASPAGEEASEVGLAARRPATADERLAALEKTVADQRGTIARLEEKAAAASLGPMASGLLRPANFYHNLDAASAAMKLSDRQEADMQETIDLAKRELSDLYAIENDEGETWAELRKGKMTTIGEGFQVSMPDFKKLAAFRKSRIPGTAETFGEADRRIKKRAYGDMRRGLTPEQGKQWDGAQKGPLLGGGAGGDGLMFSTVSLDIGGVIEGGK